LTKTGNSNKLQATIQYIFLTEIGIILEYFEFPHFAIHSTKMFMRPKAAKPFDTKRSAVIKNETQNE